MDYLDEFYRNYEEEGRLLSQSGQVEYLTTMKYIRDCIDSMDSFTFDKFMEYHSATCERADLMGASNHTLDILRKI